MAEIQVSSYALKDLKHSWITAKHWKLLFREAGTKQRYSADFTLKDILDSGIYSHEETVCAIHRLARREHEQNQLLLSIQEQVDTMEIKL